MADDTAVTRRLNLMHLLRARRLGASVREIAHEMVVSEKTVRRDLGYLLGIAYPIEEATGDRGRKTWRYIGNGSTLPLTLTYWRSIPPRNGFAVTRLIASSRLRSRIWRSRLIRTSTFRITWLARSGSTTVRTM